jgi:hypothetical protein
VGTILLGDKSTHVSIDQILVKKPHFCPLSYVMTSASRCNERKCFFSYNREAHNAIWSQKGENTFRGDTAA